MKIVIALCCASIFLIASVLGGSKNHVLQHNGHVYFKAMDGYKAEIKVKKDKATDWNNVDWKSGTDKTNYYQQHVKDVGPDSSVRIKVSDADPNSDDTPGVIIQIKYPESSGNLYYTEGDAGDIGLLLFELISDDCPDGDRKVILRDDPANWDRSIFDENADLIWFEEKTNPTCTINEIVLQFNFGDIVPEPHPIDYWKYTDPTCVISESSVCGPWKLESGGLDGNGPYCFHDGNVVSLTGSLEWAGSGPMGNESKTVPGINNPIAGYIGKIDNAAAWPMYTQTFSVMSYEEHFGIPAEIEIRDDGIIRLKSWFVPKAYYSTNGVTLYEVGSVAYENNAFDHLHVSAYDGTSSASTYEKTPKIVHFDGVSYLSLSYFTMDDAIHKKKLYKRGDVTVNPFSTVNPIVYIMFIISMGFSIISIVISLRKNGLCAKGTDNYSKVKVVNYNDTETEIET